MRAFQLYATARRTGRFIPVCLLVWILGGASPGFAESGPVRSAPPPAPAAPPSVPILAPQPPAHWLPFSPIGELFLSALPPVAPGDKGSTFTSGPIGPLPPSINALEEMKLEMARDAIERSRAMGTLLVAPIGGEERSPDPGAAERKLALLRELPSPPLLPDPAAAVGVPPPVQIPGSEGLTREERAKLEALENRRAPQREAGGEGGRP